MAIPAKIQRAIEPVLARNDCDLVLGTFRRERTGLVLRLLIERQGADPQKGSGVDHRLCSSVSREVGAALEAEDVIDQPYTLEVSSPGIERPLVRPEDFRRFSGRQITVKVRQSIEGRRRFRGALCGFDNGVVIVETKDGQKVNIPGDLIEKANLVYDAKSDLANAGD